MGEAMANMVSYDEYRCDEGDAAVDLGGAEASTLPVENAQVDYRHFGSFGLISCPKEYLNLHLQGRMAA